MTNDRSNPTPPTPNPTPAPSPEVPADIAATDRALTRLAARDLVSGPAGLESRVFGAVAGVLASAGRADADADTADVASVVDRLAAYDLASAPADLEHVIAARTSGVVAAAADAPASLEQRIFEATRTTIAAAAAPAPIPFDAGASRSGRTAVWMRSSSWLSAAACLLVAATIAWTLAFAPGADDTDLANGDSVRVAYNDFTFDDLMRVVDEQNAALDYTTIDVGATGDVVDDEWCPLCDWYAPELEGSS